MAERPLSPGCERPSPDAPRARSGRWLLPYDEVVRRLTEAGVFPADGLDYELCFGSDGNLKVSQVWDSREQLDAFGERLRPILAEVGINPGEPEVLEVHNIGVQNPKGGEGTSVDRLRAAFVPTRMPGVERSMTAVPRPEVYATATVQGGHLRKPSETLVGRAKRERGRLSLDDAAR